MEVLIVVSIIAAIAIAFIVYLNPIQQINKGMDAKRKLYLDKLTKSLEGYYNDNKSYPDGNYICYDSIQSSGDNCFCHIGSTSSAKFKNYIGEMQKDPQSPDKDYLYQYDCSSSKPSWYRICSQLSTAVYTGKYNYGVSSPNVSSDECTNIDIVSNAPQPTVDPNSVNYYCSSTGCKLCFVNNGKGSPYCGDISDYCSTSHNIYQTQSDCEDPNNGCDCL